MDYGPKFRPDQHLVLAEILIRIGMDCGPRCRPDHHYGQWANILSGSAWTMGQDFIRIHLIAAAQTDIYTHNESIETSRYHYGTPAECLNQVLQMLCCAPYFGSTNGFTYAVKLEYKYWTCNRRPQSTSRHFSCLLSCLLSSVQIFRVYDADDNITF